MPAQKKSAKFLKQKQAPVGQYTNFKIMKNYNTNEKLALQKLPYTKMLKGEIAEYAKRTLDIVGKEDHETLLITPLVNLLSARKPEIDILGIRYGIDPLRSKIMQMRSKMMLTISAFKLQVRLLSKAGIDSDLHHTQTYIDTYLRSLNALNDKRLSQRVVGFLNAAKTELPFKEALLSLNLMSHVEEIELAHTDMQSVVTKRVNILSQRPDLPTKVAVERVSGAINDLFKGIEVAHLTNPDLDYEPLVDELNQSTAMFRLSIQLRDAYNKRKANGEDVDGETGDGTGDDTGDGTGDDTGDEPELDNTGTEGSTDMQTTAMRSNKGYDPYWDKNMILADEEKLADEADEATEANTDVLDGDLEQEAE